MTTPVPPKTTTIAVVVEVVVFNGLTLVVSEAA
jgi:hypothetical protein